MSIVGGLFRQFAPTLIDNLEAQGVLKAGLLEGRAAPSTVPEMFIGTEGITNLGKSGVTDSAPILDAMQRAESEWFTTPDPKQWADKWAKQGIVFDPVAEKAMLEISDKNVNVQPGIDLNKMPSNEFLGFDEVFKADTLKKAYPEIGDIKIGFVDDAKSARLAAYDPTSDSILFNRQNPEWQKGYDPVKTVLHEVQHYIQGKEMFTGGESFQGVLKASVPFQESAQNLSKLVNTSTPELLQFAKQHKGLGFNIDKLTDVMLELKKNNGMNTETALAQAFKSKDMAAKLIKFAKNTPIEEILRAKDANSAQYKQALGDYMRVSGEAFARQTEQRRDLTLNERLQQPVIRAIDTDAINKAYGINFNNLTPSKEATQVHPQDVMADPFAMAVPQSTIPGI